MKMCLVCMRLVNLGKYKILGTGKLHHDSKNLSFPDLTPQTLLPCTTKKKLCQRFLSGGMFFSTVCKGCLKRKWRFLCGLHCRCIDSCKFRQNLRPFQQENITMNLPVISSTSFDEWAVFCLVQDVNDWQKSHFFGVRGFFRWGFFFSGNKNLVPNQDYETEYISLQSESTKTVYGCKLHALPKNVPILTLSARHEIPALSSQPLTQQKEFFHKEETEIFSRCAPVRKIHRDAESPLFIAAVEMLGGGRPPE